MVGRLEARDRIPPGTLKGHQTSLSTRLLWRKVKHTAETCYSPSGDRGAIRGQSKSSIITAVLPRTYSPHVMYNCHSSVPSDIWRSQADTQTEPCLTNSRAEKEQPQTTAATLNSNKTRKHIRVPENSITLHYPQCCP